jgi:hypothetical protein
MEERISTGNLAVEVPLLYHPQYRSSAFRLRATFFVTFCGMALLFRGRTML